MSADNGWILRKNINEKFVMQEYNASADDFPPINEPQAFIFDTVAEALTWFETTDPYSEYGLTVRVVTVTKDR